MSVRRVGAFSAARFNANSAATGATLQSRTIAVRGGGFSRFGLSSSSRDEHALGASSEPKTLPSQRLYGLTDELVNEMKQASTKACGGSSERATTAEQAIIAEHEAEKLALASLTDCQKREIEKWCSRSDSDEGCLVSGVAPYSVFRNRSRTDTASASSSMTDSFSSTPPPPPPPSRYHATVAAATHSSVLNRHAMSLMSGFLSPTFVLRHRGPTAAQREIMQTLMKANPKLSREDALKMAKNPKVNAKADKPSKKTSSANVVVDDDEELDAMLRNSRAMANGEEVETFSVDDNRSSVIAVEGVLGRNYQNRRKELRVKSEVVDTLIQQMAQRSALLRKSRKERTVEEENYDELKRYADSRRMAGKRLRVQHKLDPTTPVDHLSLKEMYEYLFAALKGGEIQEEARRRIPMSMRMAVGERSLEVPTPSFIYVLLQNDPNLLQESFHPRITFAVEQWLRLPVSHRKYFMNHPLKGISE